MLFDFSYICLIMSFAFDTHMFSGGHLVTVWSESALSARFWVLPERYVSTQSSADVPKNFCCKTLKVWRTALTISVQCWSLSNSAAVNLCGAVHCGCRPQSALALTCPRFEDAELSASLDRCGNTQL